MNAYTLEPRDPLIVRDGRPFGPDPGDRARSLPFPMPSTLAGALRTRAGSDASGRFAATPAEVLGLELRGPLLAELGPGGEPAGRFAPAPRDALMLEAARLYRLSPRALPGRSDLEPGLLPVAPGAALQGKPKGMPAFWRWEAFERWLLEPPAPERLLETTPAELGTGGPTREFRTHVALEPTGTAREGALFATSGLEFTALAPEAPLRTGPLARAARLGLLLESAAALESHQLGLAPLGGERRLARWRRVESGLPRPPAGLLEGVLASRACRVVLLTPACFAAGWRPGWLLAPRPGLELALVGAAVGRPSVVSGWDFAAGRPKPARRLAPAGSVYFLKLAGADEAIAAWLEEVWMRNVSDGDQDRLDGFGLAALGVWEEA